MPEWWTPKVDVVNTYADEDGKSYEVKTTMLASKDSVGIVKMCSKCRKAASVCDCEKPWLKDQFLALGQGVRMSLLVPALRYHIENCITERHFKAPPILEVTKKRGKFIGRKADELQDLEAEVEMMRQMGDPGIFQAEARLKALKIDEQAYAREWRVLQVFVPYDPYLFNADYVPAVSKGESRVNWAIQAQIYGPKENLMELVKTFHGVVLTDEYEEDSEGGWHLVDSSDKVY